MPFPVSYSTTLILKIKNYQVDVRTLVHKILNGLQKKQTSSVHNVANSIYFKDGFGFFGSWNILPAVSAGTIVVQEQDGKLYINYRLKFNQIIAVSIIVFVTSIGLALHFLTQTNTTDTKTTPILLLVLLVLFGGHYCLTILRFLLFIKKTITSAGMVPTLKRPFVKG